MGIVYGAIGRYPCTRICIIIFIGLYNKLII